MLLTVTDADGQTSTCVAGNHNRSNPLLELYQLTNQFVQVLKPANITFNWKCRNNSMAIIN
jgi:hypothetical protein